MKFREKLYNQYREEIESWDFDRLTFYIREGECNDFYESCWFGTVFGLTPSGKVYTFWTTNQTAKDVMRDEAWWEALTAVLDSKGYWHEGDSGDIFICRNCQSWVKYESPSGKIYNDRIYPTGYFAGEPEGYEPVPCDELGNEL